MKRIRRFTLVTLAVLVICGGASPAWAGEDPSVQQIKDSFNHYIDAWTRCDLPKLSEVYATDEELVVYWPDPNRPFLLQGWTAVRKGLEEIFEALGKIELEFTLQQINVYGDIAVLTSNWKWLTPSGPIDPSISTGRLTLVFQRR